MSRKRLMVTPPLVVQNVTKRFRQGDSVVEAMKNVSLTINTGEFVAVMGASGVEVKAHYCMSWRDLLGRIKEKW